MKVEAGVMLFWWLVFGGIHVVLSSRRVRPTLVAGMGEWPFWGAYSIAALATFVPLVAYFFRHKHEGLHFWSARMITHDLTVVLMAFAAALLATGLAARPPSAVMGQASPQVRGILRVTRHPTFAAFFVFGLAHCLVNGFLVDLIFFGGFAVFAWLGAFGYRDEFPTAIELLRSGRVKTEFLVTDAFPLDRIAEGFERQRSKDKTLKVVITP